MENNNVIAIVIGLLAWGIIGFLAYRKYKKQDEKPKVGKALIIIFVGIFSFSFNWSMFDMVVKLPILPLGVWILYFIFQGKSKKDRWQVYRSFAWLGFFANFIFLAATLITVPIHHIIYPKDEPATYIANVEHASLIKIHPSGQNRMLQKEKVSGWVETATKERIHSDVWYEETYMNPDASNVKERFPFQLVGASAEWGSGLEPLIFIEQDGKGMLITTSKQQLYFRSEDSLLKEGR